MENRTPFVKLPQSTAGRSKNWRTLRAICLLLFMSISLTAYSQITVDLKGISLRASLKKIEQVSNYKFFYSESLPELSWKVSLNVRDVTIDQTMTRLLEGMELTYKKEQENVIVLIRKTQSKQLTKKVTGTVVDANGEPIIGASIVIKGESHGTITDFDGKFALPDVPEKAVLTISYIGYKSQEIPVNGQQNLNIILDEDVEALDEVVVVGYATGSKRTISGAVERIKKEDMNQGVVNTPLESLKGKVAGVVISKTGGDPASKPSIRVRCPVVMIPW